MDSDKLNDKILHYRQENPKQVKSLYNTIELDKNGINYNNWFKLYHNTHFYIKDVGVEGLYLLFNLISHKSNLGNEYLNISLKSLLKSTQLKDIRTVKKYIKKLIDNKLIYIKDYTEKTNQNELLDIIILYKGNNGYKPIPKDYFQRCLRNLPPIQCSIVLILIELFKFFDCYNYVNEETGEIIYTYLECEYAFPTLSKLADILDSDRHTVMSHITDLAKKDIISYTVLNKKPFWYTTREGFKFKNPNYRYRVKLLQCLEYNYYLVKGFDSFDYRNKKDIKKIRYNIPKILKSENFKSVKPTDWLSYRYEDVYFKYFKKALDSKDFEYYKGSKSKLIIDKFNNNNLKKN